MANLEFRVLTSDAEIDKFLEEFKKYVKVKLPEAYAKRCVVTGVFKKNEMIGGYMLLTKGPFRSLAFVPDEVKNSLTILKEAGATEFVEVNGFWVKETYRRTRESLEMWLQLRKDIIATKSSYLLLFYNAKAEGLASIYETAMNPRTIYQGPPMKNDIASTVHEEIKVSIVTRLDMRLGLVRGMKVIMARRLSSLVA